MNSNFIHTNTLLLSALRSKGQILFSFTTLLVVLLMAAGAGKMQAQANAANYAFAVSNTGSFTDMSTGTSTLIAADQDDAASAVTNIGFDFYLMGVRQTQFNVTTNGIFRFGTTLAAINGAAGYNPLGQAGQALLTPWGADQRTHAVDGKVHYKVTGTAPNRVLTVEWLNMQSYYDVAGTSDLTYQLRIYETTGVIESVYGPMTMSTAGAGDANCNSPQFGLSTGNTVGTVGSVTAAQSGVPAPTYSGAAATPVNNLYTTGVITALNSVADGSRVMFTYTPPVPLTPTGLNFTAVSATGMTLNWTDNATNEVNYFVYRSTDAVNYSLSATLAANTSNYTPGGLAASTTYHWRVFAVSEGALSNTVTGTQATSPAGVITSTASGLWSDPNTWSTGVVPTTNDMVTIASGHTVIIDIAAFAYNLTIDGTLEFEQTTARTLTVFSDVIINAAGTFQSNPAGTQTGHVLSVGGNLVNNGTLDFSTNADTAGAGITFSGTGTATFSGTGATTDIRTITMNKGTSSASVVEVTVSNFTVRGVTTDTVVGGWLVLTNGTLKLSGTFTGTSRVFGVAAYTIPATAGFWLNNPNYIIAGQNGSPTTSGLLRISQSTYNIGVSTGNSMGFATGSTIVVEGGTVNAASRFGVSLAGNIINYTQSGGTITVCMIGNASGTLGSFDLGTSATSTVNISGGLIVCQLAATTIDYRDQAGSGITGVTGGTLQLGNAASGAAKTFNIRGVLPNTIVNNASAGHTANMGAPVTYNNVSLDFTTMPGTTFNFGNNVFLFTGNTLTNNGTMTGNGANTILYMISFSGSIITQTITGSGVFTAPFTNITSQASDVTLSTTNQIPLNRCNVLSGGFINTNKFTMGNGGTGVAVIQYGVAAQTLPVHGFDAAPTWSVGTGGMSMLYAQELTGRTTGFEIPPSRMLNVLSITNTNNLTISGGDITIGGTGATNSFSMSTGNVITGTNTIILGTSTTQVGTFGYPVGGGIIIGNFKRWLSATTGARDFPVGIAGAKRTASINYTTAPTTGGSLSTHWVSAPAGTNGLPLTEGALSVNGTADGYWSITPGDGLSGGSFAGTFTATGIPNITDVTQLVLVQRTNSSSPWTLDGTHVTGAGTPAVPVLSRTGMSAYTEFGIGSQEFCNASVSSLSDDADNVICSTTAVTFTANPTNGGTPTYQWNVNGLAVSSATNSTFTSSTLTNSDVVTVVMTAAGNTCFSSPATSTGITMTVNPLPTVSSTSNTAALCFGDANGSAIVDANGVGGVTYSWSPGGATTSTVTGLAAGTYSVLITDGNFCSITQTVAVAQPSMLNASSTADAILCNGGVATVTVDATGGTSAYTGTGIVNNVMAGTYTYTVSDANGCSSTTSITISEPTVLTASTSATSILCNGGTADVTVSAAGGTATYTGTGTFTSLTAGTYTYMVSDFNGCSTTTSITITEPTAITSATSSVNSNCGNSNGSASTTANGGTGTLDYSWAPVGGTAATATGLSAGSYTVTITDDNNCSITDIVSVSDIGAPSVLTASVNVSCNGLTDGSIDNTISGGTGTYTYTWSNSMSTEDLTTLPAGVYTYTVTDGAGCSTIGSVTITEPAAIDVSTSALGNMITANNSGATSYQWIDCDNSNLPISGETNASFTATLSGNYAVIVTEGLCSATSTCVNVLVTGIKETAATIKLAIYPNPGTGIYTVSADTKITHIAVMNALGEVVYQSAENNVTSSVDISKYASGVYTFAITTANKTAQQRVVKQ